MAAEGAGLDVESVGLFIDSVKDYAIFTLDQTGRVTSWNRGAERIKGHSEEEILGKSLATFYTPEDIARGHPQEFLKQAADQGRAEEESQRVRKDGTRFWAHVVLTAVRDDDGSLQGFVKVTRDISERKRAEQQLQWMRDEMLRQERIRSIAQLSSVLAHDLNNVLNAIALRLSLVASETGRSENVDKLHSLVFHAADSVRRLQEFVRSHREPLLENLDLATVIRDALDVVRPSLETPTAKGEVLVKINIPDLPAVFGSRTDLLQVFTNLLMNAGDAMPAGGVVEIDAHRDNGTIVLTVADRGTGIRTQDLENVFNPFFSTKQNPASGLGLSFASSVMARMGGTIDVSNRVDGGAIFVLKFPIAGHRELPQHTPSRGQTHSLLVVDDDFDNLEGMKAALESRGYAISVASSGPEALGLIQSGHRFDAVLCDIGMPDMNGWEVALRISELQPQTRLYMLSGWANEIPDTDPRRKLVVDVIAKPVSLELVEGILGAKP